MKFLHFILLLSCISFISVKANAQSFEKHTLLLEIKPGIGGFTTDYSDQINGQSPSGGAALFILPITLEYGVANWLGIGGLIETSHYIQNKDSVAAGKGIIGNSFEIGPLANAHFLRTKHTDLYAGVKLALSGVKLTGESSDIVLKSGGSMFDVCVGSRFIIGNHFALSAELGYMYYGYPNGTITDDPAIQNVGFALYLTGVSFNIGLGYKF